MILQSDSNKRIVKFIISGGTATATNFVLLYFFVDIVHLWYLAGSGLAFVVAFFVSFSLQKFFTFKDQEVGRIYKQLFQYLIVTLSGLAFNLLSMWVLVDHFGLWYMLAQFFTSAVVAVGNYFAYREFIFKN
jgi:putative flippase GtrA